MGHRLLKIIEAIICPLEALRKGLGDDLHLLLTSNRIADHSDDRPSRLNGSQVAPVRRFWAIVCDVHGQQTIGILLPALGRHSGTDHCLGLNRLKDPETLATVHPIVR
jgi:hypothetical protein